MKRPTRSQIERAADAVVRLMRTEGGKWNPKFLESAKWPESFYPSERREAREIARAALRAAFSE